MYISVSDNLVTWIDALPDCKQWEPQLTRLLSIMETQNGHN